MVYRKKWRHAPVLLLGHVYRWWWHARPSVHPHKFLGLCCVRIQTLTHNQYHWVLNWFRWILARVGCKNTPTCKCFLQPVGVNIDNNSFILYLKVCHSSAFQTISRRSVYIKIINNIDSISANLNKTIQTKQHTMKKPQSYSNRNKIY